MRALEGRGSEESEVLMNIRDLSGCGRLNALSIKEEERAVENPRSGE